MANASKFPLSTELYLGQWSLKGASAPKLSSPISATATILSVSAPLKDKDGNIVTGGFHMGVKKSNGWVETIWVPAGAVSVDGLTIGTALIPVVRGINPNGYDYITGSSDFADTHRQGEPVFCNITAILPELIRSALQGLIATGGSDLIIGTDASGTVTVSRSTGTGTYVGFLRWYTTSSTAQFSNDGSVWTSISDATASVIFKVAATDTTPGYAKDKIIGSSSITVTQTNIGGNETLVLTTSLPDVIDAHEIYTPAYMTGGASAETTVALWDNLTDASFRGTFDGVAVNVDGMDMTATGPLGIVTDMDDVAAVIQHYLRAITGTLETVVWSTDHFVITSADTTVASEVSVLSTSSGTVGTDISGAGADTWMDCDTGNGTATAAVLDPTQDAGKLVKLDATGIFAIGAVPAGTVVPFAGATAPSGWLLCDGTTGLDSVADTSLADLYAVIGTTFGGTGADDFDLPDMRGNFPLGKDNMGGSARNRVTDAAADTIGSEGGEQTHQLTVAELPAHNHNLNFIANTSGHSVITATTGYLYDDTSDGATYGSPGAVGAFENTEIVADTGSNTAHENMSPYMTFNYIIKK